MFVPEIIIITIQYECEAKQTAIKISENPVRSQVAAIQKQKSIKNYF